MRQKVLMLALLALLLGQTAHAFYNPVRGTWLSRDPIEERGGINLYEMNGNHPIKGIDCFGLELIDSPSASLEAAMARGDVEGVEAILLGSGEGGVLTDAAIAAARAWLKKVVECKALNYAYHNPECGRCSCGLSREANVNNLACFFAQNAARAEYLHLKCDYCLVGSIATEPGGSKAAEAAHWAQLSEKLLALARCVKTIALIDGTIIRGK